MKLLPVPLSFLYCAVRLLDGSRASTEMTLYSRSGRPARKKEEGGVGGNENSIPELGAKAEEETFNC